MRTALFQLGCVLMLLGGCGDHEVNPPTKPAKPLRTPEAMQPVEAPGPTSLASRGADSFVGVWAGNLQWCAQPQGERSPVTITPMRFDAYGKSCDIKSIREREGGYATMLDCAEGKPGQRVFMGASGDVLTLTYIDQDMHTVKLARCPGTRKDAPQGGGLMNMLKKDG